MVFTAACGRPAPLCFHAFSVPLKFVGTEIALHVGEKRNSLIRNLQVKAMGKDSSSSGPFSRKTDGTEL